MEHWTRSFTLPKTLPTDFQTTLKKPNKTQDSSSRWAKQNRREVRGLTAVFLVCLESRKRVDSPVC